MSLLEWQKGHLRQVSQPDEILLHKTASYQEVYDRLQTIMIPEEKRGTYALSTVGGASIPDVEITMGEED